MRLLPVLFLIACHGQGKAPVDDASPHDTAIDRDAAVIDARPDAPPTPAVDWSNWGDPCDRSIYGAETCFARDGVTKGLCILTGEAPTNSVYPGACRHSCYANPPYIHECPLDGHAVYDGQHSQGCHCAQN